LEKDTNATLCVESRDRIHALIILALKAGVDDGSIRSNVGPLPFFGHDSLGLHPRVARMTASSRGPLEHTFPQKRTLTMILEIRYNVLIYNIKVGRLATELVA
jgi:hypothetical protein